MKSETKSARGAEAGACVTKTSFKACAWSCGTTKTPSPGKQRMRLWRVAVAHKKRAPPARISVRA